MIYFIGMALHTFSDFGKGCLIVRFFPGEDESGGIKNKEE